MFFLPTRGVGHDGWSWRQRGYFKLVHALSGLDQLECEHPEISSWDFCLVLAMSPNQGFEEGIDV